MKAANIYLQLSIMSTAFVLGNGQSRLAIDLNQLKSYGKIYGCNALYRNFTPDVLVASDPEIAREIQLSNYAMQNIFYTRKPLPNLGARAIKEYYGFSSGPVALSLACKENYDKIFLLGFDLAGIDGKFNNVYADTEFYKKSNQSATYYGNWVNQIATIARDFKHVQIVHVIGNTTLKPKEWHDLIRFETMDTFSTAINNSKLEQV